ncbi:MAG: WYL domain-containing protein [Bacteroidota bacterium]|nr:WYL domain-containing protein [Bacteroidota bacterium]
MSFNKNALIRYHTLDKCFRNPGKMYFWDDLLENCNTAIQDLEPNQKGIRRRQLFLDIRFMESEQGWSIPLERLRFGRKVYYRYYDISFSIKNQPLNEIEAMQIKSALLILSRFKGMPQFEWINEIIARIEQSISIKQDSQSVISFDSNDYLKGIHYLGDFFNAIIYKEVLKISYKLFTSDEQKEFEIHPYYIKQYNNRWFLFGLNPSYNELTNLALDRIENFSKLNKTYIENEKYDFEEYFEDIIGVSIPPKAKLTKIDIKISQTLAPYIKTKPLHGSQKKIKDDKNELIISIEIIPNYEFEQLILSFGNQVEILNPQNIKEEIKSRLKKALSNY